MAPSDYLAEVALPTAREFLQSRGDRRLAYLACISAFHLCDYIARAKSITLCEAREPIRTCCQPSFDIIEGICNGSKHCGRDGRGAFAFSPGIERDIQPFGLGQDFGGLGEGRWLHNGLAVAYEGRKFLVDECLIDFLKAAAAAFPAHFSAAAHA